MSCPGRMVLHEAPLECQLLPVTQMYPSHSSTLLLLSQSTKRACAWCSDRLFWGGGQFVLRLYCLAPLSWDTHPHPEAHMCPSCFRRALRPLKGSKHAHYPHADAAVTSSPTQLGLWQFYPSICSGKGDLRLWAQAMITSDTPAPGMKAAFRDKEKNNYF